MAQEEQLGIGIDFGTSNLLVYVKGYGIIFNEPSVVAFDIESGEVIAGGHDANAMIGKTHSKVIVSRPLRDGVISDMDAATALLTYAFQKVKGLKQIQNGVCMICCPSEVSQIEQEALKELAEQMGIGEAYIDQEIKSGAIGSGIDIYTPKAAMIVDIGGGTTDVGVLSLGDVVLSRTIPAAGNYIDLEVMKYLRKQHNLVIGSGTAERVKIEGGTLIASDGKRKVDVYGRDLITGLPSSAVVTSKILYELLLPIFDEITTAVYSVLEQTPPELAADIVETGITLEGGVSLVPGIKDYFEKALGLPVTLAEDPLMAVVSGAKVLLSNKGNYLVAPQD